jgi:peptidoglycan/LPS O-acetylase OafA/YrhL
MVVIDGGDSWWWQPAMQRIGFSLIAMTAASLLVMSLQAPEGRWPRMMSAGWLRAFGKYSYCLYLVHLPAMRAVREYVFDPGDYAMLAPWVGQLIFYVVATAPAFAVAWLSWRYFEAPILSLKSRFAA